MELFEKIEKIDEDPISCKDLLNEEIIKIIGKLMTHKFVYPIDFVNNKVLQYLNFIGVERFNLGCQFLFGEYCQLHENQGERISYYFVFNGGFPSMKRRLRD